MSDEPSPPLRARPRAFRLAPETVSPPPDELAGRRTGPDTTSAPAAPRAYRLDATSTTRPGVQITDQPDPFPADLAAGASEGEAAIETAQRQGMAGRGRLVSWAGLFWAATGGLVSLGVGLSITRLVDDLFARVPGLGWLALALLGTALLALAALLIRETAGIARQRHIALLHKRIADAHTADDRVTARQLLPELSAIYRDRPELAAAREKLAALSDEIIDGRDLLDLAETHLLAPLDRTVQREIATAARGVSLVTAISPRAVLDLVVVVVQIVRLIRRIAEVYSGRPGLLGFLRLARSVGTHLAITGGMAVGESLIQQVVGHGIAARLSARLGEGVLNGVLTTRVGLSAMAVCRPMPFAARKQPGAKEVAPFLFGDSSG